MSIRCQNCAPLNLVETVLLLFYDMVSAHHSQEIW